VNYLFEIVTFSIFVALLGKSPLKKSRSTGSNHDLSAVAVFARKLEIIWISKLTDCRSMLVATPFIRTQALLRLVLKKWDSWLMVIT